MKPLLSRLAALRSVPHAVHKFVLTSALVAFVAPVMSPAPAMAENLFAPVVKVNDTVITRYELQQRARMLQLFRTPGDPLETAREQLIEERLKLDAAKTLGLEVSPDDVTAGMDEFAARANMNAEQFIRALDGAGVSGESFRDFVSSGVMWRQLVRAKFAARVAVSQSDVDRALKSTGAGNIRVLLSEIIIPARPGQERAVTARAAKISKITSISAFAAQARKYSASGSRARGGKLSWMPITNLPPAIQSQILALAPGQVTAPISIQGAVALFQMRKIEAGKAKEPEYSAIEYAAYYIPGGRTEKALTEARKLKSRVDTCDDLYGVAKGKPEEVLDRGSKKPSEIPTDIAIELAKLDKHEISTLLTRSNGKTLVFLMMCGRTLKLTEDVSRDNVLLSLQNRRLASYAEGYLEQLRAEARIIYK